MDLKTIFIRFVEVFYKRLPVFFLMLSFVMHKAALATDIPDPEDKIYATGLIPEDWEELSKIPQTPTMRAFLPPIVDLSNRFPRVGNQGNQGSCTAWAVGYAARAYYGSQPRQGYKLRASNIPSPAYIYNSIRGSDATCQDGTRISAALNLLKSGVVSHDEFPYHEKSCHRPSPSMKKRANRFKIEKWLVVDTKRLDQVKGELAKGHPVIIGMRPNNDFRWLRGRKIWRAGVPVEKDGHHAITVTGYHEKGQYFKFINSWGRGWGDKGFGRMSYSTFLKRVKYGFSMRLAKKPLPPKPPAPPKPPVPVPHKLILPEIGCGKLAVSGNAKAPLITGYVGKDEDLSKIVTFAKSKKAKVDVALRPWPQCETLMTLDEPLKHQAKPEILLDKKQYSEGETLSFNVNMASFQGYLHVAYIQADGQVVNLVKTDLLNLNTLPKSSKLTFGDGKEGRPKFTISRPFGDEMIVVVASKSPLFQENRPLVETEREFLTALRKAILARPDTSSDMRTVSANFITLKTNGN